MGKHLFSSVTACEVRRAVSQLQAPGRAASSPEESAFRSPHGVPLLPGILTRLIMLSPRESMSEVGNKSDKDFHTSSSNPRRSC